ncbi:MAG TPA: serine protease [Armatimonadota bacterium]|nr:serine protease [Armatimonadota bacterium]
MKSSSIRCFIIMGALACALLPTMPLRADEFAQSARAVTAKWKDSLVRIKVVAKVTVTTQGTPSTDEEKGEISGTVIDPSGLIVTSLMSTDPSESMENAAGEMGDDTKISIQLTGLTIVLPDGSELPGKLVLRDKDLDLAFIRLTKKPAKPLPAVDLANASQPELLDQTVIMYRLGTVANRAINATESRIEAIIEKPRKQYVLGVAGYTSEIGSPVFTLDGKIVGILLNKVTKSAQEEDHLNIILPASDIADAAAQAPATTDAN